MKKIVVFILALVLVLFSVNTYAAESFGGYALPIDIDINGNFIKCVKKPVLINGITYIPLRAFSDAIGAAVAWDETEKAATITKENHTFVFYSEKAYCLIDGVQKNCQPVIVENLMFIPVRVVSEALGYRVAWDAFNLAVQINADTVSVSEACIDRAYTYEDILYLGKIIWIESGYAHFDVKLGVGATVMNRVRYPSFPNTVKGVIYDTKYGVQFPPVYTSKINQTPSYESMVAAKCVLNGVNIVGNSLYFIEKRNAKSSWANRNRPYFGTIHDMCFYE